MSWQEAQKWESGWWGNCTNTLSEDIKQITYARLMGLQFTNHDGHLVIDLQGTSVIDIGGGPSSLLLKCINHSKAMVVDPCDYPEWTAERYKAANITLLKMMGENIEKMKDPLHWTESWIYNCLQHTSDPEKVITKAKDTAETLRIFEWIDEPTNAGHPHMLTEAKLNEWIGQSGNVVQLAENECFGKAYYGVFNL